MTTLRDHTVELTRPFPPEQIDLKPGVMTREKTRAIPMAYVDARVYQERLDQVVGPDAWSVDFSVRRFGVVCTLTICGVTKADVGDYPLDDETHRNENKATTAAAQAFKRACAQFGVGRYLYSLPRLWADYDPDKKQFLNPAGIVAALYHAAGISITASAQPAQGTSTPNPKLARAREALATAEAQVAHLGRPGKAEAVNGRMATEKQLRYLARLLQESQASQDELDGLANQVGLTTKDFAQIGTLTLSAQIASTLIDELLALQELHTA
jgi:hypothetical protein